MVVREDGQAKWETDYETCMMCGNEKIRYVHIVEHAEVGEAFRVGCTCAVKMTNDYLNPERRERELRNRANRRINWSKFEDVFGNKQKFLIEMEDMINLRNPIRHAREITELIMSKGIGSILWLKQQLKIKDDL